MHGIQALAHIFKKVQEAKNLGILPQKSDRKMPVLMKQMKSKMRHKLLTVSQDKKIGKYLKENRLKILKSILSEQNGFIIVKNPEQQDQRLRDLLERHEKFVGSVSPPTSLSAYRSRKKFSCNRRWSTSFRTSWRRWSAR